MSLLKCYYERRYDLRLEILRSKPRLVRSACRRWSSLTVIALIIFGPRKLPELGKSLGKSIAEFKRASNELKNTLEDEIRTEELQETRSRRNSPDAATRRRASGPAPRAHTAPRGVAGAYRESGS